MPNNDKLDMIREYILRKQGLGLDPKYQQALRTSQRGDQRDADELARYGHLAEGLSQAAAKVGGTRPAPNITAAAARFQKQADIARHSAPQVGPGGIDPKIMNYFAKQQKLQKEKPRVFKPYNYKDPYGFERTGKVDAVTAEVITSKNDTIKSPPEIGDLTIKFRNELNKENKAAKLVETQYRKVADLIKKAEEINERGGSTAALDYAIIKAFEKVNDPTSVVREAEFANVGNLGGVLNTWYNSYAKFKQGDLLTPKVRADLGRAVEIVYKGSLDGATIVENKHRVLVDKYRQHGVDIDFDTMIGNVYTKPKEIGDKKRQPSSTGFPRVIYKTNADGEYMKATVNNKDELQEARQEGWE